MSIRSNFNSGKCLSPSEISNAGGQLVNNNDGTVSVFIPNNQSVLVPVILTKICCEHLGSQYTFDIDSQKCRWSEPPTSCEYNQPIKVVLNPKGNDGSLFYINEGDICSLSVDFDYLFKIKCETLFNLLSPNNFLRVNSNVLDEAKTLKTQVDEQNKTCSEYTSKIKTLQDSIINTPYSIECEIVQEPITPKTPSNSNKVISNFGKTGFGKLDSTAPFSFYMATNSTGTYCLTETDGLNAWANILGPIKYQRFLDGDATSYTCDDVNAIVTQNSVNLLSHPTGPILVDLCNVPFGTKTALIKELNETLAAQQECQKSITNLNTQIQSLEDNNLVACDNPIDFFETFDVSFSVDVITSANTLQSVYTQQLFTQIGAGNLYDYLVTTQDSSGFFMCGEPDCIPMSLTGNSNAYSCDSIIDNLMDTLFEESGLSGTTDGVTIFEDSLSPNSFASQWLHYHTVITDPDILAAIANQKIKISMTINHTCGDFCVLVDEIVLDKICTNVSEKNIFLTQSPGFEMGRIRDNKKSWLANNTPVNRVFDISDNRDKNSIRQTDYDVNDERLVINTKEIDLDINIASAIETDIWCYISDNPCLLTGVSMCNPCSENCGNKTFQDDSCFDFMDDYIYDFMDGTANTKSFVYCCGDNQIDFISLMTQPLSAVTTIEDFKYFLTSELIDAKNRQTISGYPTLRALYERYMNSGLYCAAESSRFTYLTIDQFAGLLDNYWVDIVEQVVPATTIWGSVKVYSNTIFDQQKFTYRKYSSLFCGNAFSGENVSSPINGVSGTCASVEVAVTPIILPSSNVRISKPITSYCDSICLAQMNAGSEFIGSVSVIINSD